MVMDATVSWGGPNYRFRNDTDYPVKIQAVYSKGYLTMDSCRRAYFFKYSAAAV